MEVGSFHTRTTEKILKTVFGCLGMEPSASCRRVLSYIFTPSFSQNMVLPLLIYQSWMYKVKVCKELCNIFSVVVNSLSSIETTLLIVNQCVKYGLFWCTFFLDKAFFRSFYIFKFLFVLQVQSQINIKSKHNLTKMYKSCVMKVQMILEHR